MEKSILSYKLKQYRLDQKLTQQDLAEMLDVSDKSVSKWELGEGYPSKKNLLKISEILGISIEVLLIEQEQNQNKPNGSKLSIMYGAISYIIIFTLGILISLLKMDSLDIMVMRPLELLEFAITQFIFNNLLAIPPAITIGCVFYFCIFPNSRNDEN